MSTQEYGFHVHVPEPLLVTFMAPGGRRAEVRVFWSHQSHAPAFTASMFWCSGVTSTTLKATDLGALSEAYWTDRDGISFEHFLVVGTIAGALRFAPLSRARFKGETWFKFAAFAESSTQIVWPDDGFSIASWSHDQEPVGNVGGIPFERQFVVEWSEGAQELLTQVAGWPRAPIAVVS